MPLLHFYLYFYSGLALLCPRGVEGSATARQLQEALEHTQSKRNYLPNVHNLYYAHILYVLWLFSCNCKQQPELAPALHRYVRELSSPESTAARE